MFSRNKLATALIIVFILGLAWIIYQGRPVMNLSKTNNQGTQTVQTANSPVPSNTSSDTAFAMSEVATHNTPADCWSAINNQVYDLSSWVSRHPGGQGAIIRLCGTDGSDAFNGKHGGSRQAQSALVLLKIGQLK